MRWSKAGLVVGAGYLILAAPLLLLSALTDDDKGTVVFRQLALLPGLLVISGLDLDGAVMLSPLLNNVPVMLLFNLALAYGLGWVAARLLTLLKRGDTRGR